MPEVVPQLTRADARSKTSPGLGPVRFGEVQSDADERASSRVQTRGDAKGGCSPFQLETAQRGALQVRRWTHMAKLNLRHSRQDQKKRKVSTSVIAALLRSSLVPLSASLRAASARVCVRACNVDEPSA